MRTMGWSLEPPLKSCPPFSDACTVYCPAASGGCPSPGVATVSPARSAVQLAGSASDEPLAPGAVRRSCGCSAANCGTDGRIRLAWAHLTGAGAFAAQKEA